MTCISCGSKDVKSEAGNNEAVLYHCFACGKTFTVLRGKETQSKEDSHG